MSKKEDNVTEACFRAIDAYGTAKIFEKRLKKLEFSEKINKLMGFIAPMGVGIAVITVEVNAKLISIFTIAAGVICFVQLMISLWALINRRDTTLKQYSDSKSANYYYANKFRDIWKRYDQDEEKYAKLLERFVPLDDEQQKIDQGLLGEVSLEEKHFGMREALYQYQHKCKECGKIPDLKHPETCKIFGK
jgi:mobilome CxxCx(11)CxxC protein